MVGVEADPVHVELLGAVNIGHRYRDELGVLPVHAQQPTRGSDSSADPAAASDQHVAGTPILTCRRQLAVDWVISRRWPSGSRRKQRISAPQSCGGVRNVGAPGPQRLRSGLAVGHAQRHRVADQVGVGRRCEDDRGLVGGRPPPLTSNSQVPANRSTTLVPPYSRYSSAPSTSTQKSRDRAGR